MRAYILVLLTLLLFASPLHSENIETAWNGPTTLRMERTERIITSVLEHRLSLLADNQTEAVMVFFTDKGITSQADLAPALNQAEVKLTPKAYQRRLNSRGQENLVDFRDLPVNSQYINEVLASGAKLRQVLKWFNAASFDVSREQVKIIAALPSVRLIKSVTHFKKDYDIPLEPVFPSLTLTTLNYGQSAGQLNQINVVPLHELGFKGQGAIICMMDVGYKIGHAAFQNIINTERLLAQYDFINHDNNTDYEPGQDAISQADHGTVTWSTLGGESAGNLYGPSYLASFILAKTEDVRSEQHIEEDNWAAGAEWADSIGAVVISASLGYRDFDPGQSDYQYSDMNGDNTIVTQAADLAAYNGIAVCTAMGNEGPDVGSIVAPADGDSVIACGAVDAYDSIAGFSGRGPTFDGRIKPEVCAQGVSTVCADPNNLSGYTYSGGTSLSTPLIGGATGQLLSVHRNWTPMMVREALMMTSDRAGNPDNIYGYGIMDVTRAMYYHPQGDIVFRFRPPTAFNVNDYNNISFTIRGDTSIASAQLFWRNGSTGQFTQVEMTGQNDSTFIGQIPLQSGGEINYYMKATDARGVFAFDPPGGESHPYGAGVGATQFVDSLDHGFIYWKSGGINDQWGLSAKYSRTGALSLTDSPADNYRDNTDSWVESRFSLDLSRVSGASLAFYWRGILQSGYDSLIVEASSDLGTTWNSFPQAISGTSNTFVQYTADLAPYIGQSDIRLRFRLKTNATTRREGIYIDDVTVSWIPTGVEDGVTPLPLAFTLNQNYPNPFNPSTAISFTLPEKSAVTLSVFDLLGRKVRILFAGELAAGLHAVAWDGKNDLGMDVSSGTYLYRLETGNSSAVKRMTLLR